jgi:hypothetical protein
VAGLDERGTFEIASSLLQIVFGQGVTAADRLKACQSLAELESAFLRALALDADWALVMRALQAESEEELPDLAGDGPWSRPNPLEGAASSDQTPVHECCLEPYATDFRRLVNDDFAAAALVPLELPADDASGVDLVTASACFQRRDLNDLDGCLQERLGSALGLGPAMLACLEEDDGLHGSPFSCRAFPMVLQWRLPPCIPGRLASLLGDMLSLSDWHQLWFNTVALRIHQEIPYALLDSLTAEQAAEVNLRLRSVVAVEARKAEITHTALLAGVEMFATCRLLQACSVADVRAAWFGSGGDSSAAGDRYRRAAQSDEWSFDQALRGCMQQPSPEAVQRLSAHEREAVRACRGLRTRRAGGGAGSFLV